MYPTCSGAPTDPTRGGSRSTRRFINIPPLMIPETSAPASARPNAKNSMLFCELIEPRPSSSTTTMYISPEPEKCRRRSVRALAIVHECTDRPPPRIAAQRPFTC